MAIKAGLFSGENSGYPWVGVLADWEKHLGTDGRKTPGVKACEDRLH